MAYDGRIMQRALTRFDEDKQRRAAQLEQRRRTAYARAPSLAEIEASLRQLVSMTQGEARVLAEQLTARVHELKEQ